MAYVRSGSQQPTGNAVAGDVKAGKTFSNENDVDLVGTFAAQEKTVTAGTSAASVTPDSGKYLSKVTYNPTPSQTKSVNPLTSSQAVTPDSGKLLSRVNVSAIQTETKTVTPTTSAQNVTPTSGKFLTRVTVNAISTQTKAVTASRSNQTVTPDSGKYLSQVTVNKYPDASGTYTPTGADLNNSAADMTPTNNLRYVNTAVCYNAGVSAQKSANGTKEITLMAPPQGSWCLFKLPFVCSKITWNELIYQVGPQRYVTGDLVRVRDSDGNQVGGNVPLNQLINTGSFIGQKLDQIQFQLASSDDNRQVYIRFTCE